MSHDGAASRGRPLKVWKGRGAPGDARRMSSLIPFRRSQDAPRNRFPSASRQVALFRPYRDPEPSVSEALQRSKRAGHYRPRHTLSPSTTPTAGGPGQQPGPRAVRVSPSDLSRSITPRRRNGRWPCALSSRRGGETVRQVFRPGTEGRERSRLTHPLPSGGRGPCAAWEGEGSSHSPIKSSNNQPLAWPGGPASPIPSPSHRFAAGPALSQGRG